MNEHQKECMTEFSKRLWFALKNEVFGGINCEVIGDSILVTIEYKQVRYKHKLVNVLDSIMREDPLTFYVNDILYQYKDTLFKIFFRAKEERCKSSEDGRTVGR